MKIKIIHLLNYFIIFTSFSFLFDDLLSFVLYNIFFIFTIYLSLDDEKDIKRVCFSNLIKYSGFLLLLFFIVQMIPFPYSILKEFSGYTEKLLHAVSDSLPKFHSISIIPFDTFYSVIEILILVLFGYSLFTIKYKKKDLISLIEVLTISIIMKFFVSLIIVSIIKFDKYSLINNEIRFSLILLIPLSLGLIFYKSEFLRSSIDLLERFKLFRNNSNYWFIYLLAYIIPFSFIVAKGKPWDIFLVFFYTLSFFSLIYYLKQLKKKRQILKPILIILLPIIFFIALLKINNPIIHIGNNFNTENISFSSIPSMGIGFDTSKIITPSILSYIEERKDTKIYFKSLFLLEMGWMGIIILSSFVFFILLSLIKMWKKRKHPDIKVLGVSLFCAIGCLLVLGFDNSFFHLRYYKFIVVLLIVIAFKLLLYKKDFTDEK